MADSRCKYYKKKKQVSYDNGVTWYDVIPYEYQKGELYEMESQDCGYVPPVTEYRWVKTNDTTCVEAPTYKFVGTYNNGRVQKLTCGSSTELTSDEIGEDWQKSERLVTAVIGDCVTSIAKSALYRHISLTSCTIPNSVISIGDSAFLQCSGLTSITIPDSVTSIGINAFGYCTSLTSCTIGSGVTSISNRLFADCRGLSRVNSNVDGVCNIPNNITSIGDGAFSYCPSLTSVTIPDSVTTIGNSVFSSVVEMMIGSGVTSIGSGFSNFHLQKITILATTPPTLDVSSWHGAPEIYVPCESLDAYKTAPGWKNLSHIKGIPPCEEPPIPTGTKFVANYSDGKVYELECNSRELSRSDVTPSGYQATSMTSVTIGDCVTSIGSRCFSNEPPSYPFNNLKYVTIPNSVTSLSVRAFSSCESLTRVNSDVDGVCNIPDSVTSIGGEVFKNSYSFISVIIGSGITSIGDRAFSSSHARSITINATTPPTLGKDVFNSESIYLKTIYVPASSVDAYKSASTRWSNYASYIQPIP